MYALYGHAQSDFAYKVPGLLPVIQQPAPNACWITVTTIMMSWRDSTEYKVDAVARGLGEPWLLFFEMDSGLTAANQEKFAKRIGLTLEPPASYMLTAYRDLLVRHGPLWIITGNNSIHARVLIGLEGKGDYQKTDFVFIDPDKGKIVKENVMKFYQKFEAEARTSNREKWKEDLRIQIYHF